MKVIAAWPDYGRQEVVAVTEDGGVFGVPMVPVDVLATLTWVRLAGPIQEHSQTFPRVLPTSEK